MTDQWIVTEKPVEVEAPPPTSVAQAVVKVMEDVRRIQKEDTNAFANYKYASVDDVKDRLRPLLAKHGLSVVIDQKKAKTFNATDKKGKEGLHFEFYFKVFLQHWHGDTGPKEGITVALPYVGAQTSGQARSYAIKEYMKGRFLQSTGELSEDADAQQWDITLTKQNARDIDQNMRRELVEIGKSGSADDLAVWHERNKIMIEAMPDDWKVSLRQEYSNAGFEIKRRAETERAAEALPDNPEAFLDDLDTQMQAASELAVLGEIWSENEHIINALPAEEKKQASKILEAHEDRFGLL